MEGDKNSPKELGVLLRREVNISWQITIVREQMSAGMFLETVISTFPFTLMNLAHTHMFICVHAHSGDITDDHVTPLSH